MNYVDFRKKNYTKIFIGETLFLTIISFVFSFFCKHEKIYYEESTGYEDILDSSFMFKVCPKIFAHIVPFILFLVIIIFSLTMIYIMHVKKNPIKAKRLFRYLTIISYVNIGVAIFFSIFFTSYVSYLSLGAGITYDYYHFQFGRIVTTISSILLAVNIYFWRSNFGLEKFYGSSDSIYK
ncbi:MAG: hypothetical protein ACI4U5_01815 [Bacilli bacterium]